MLPEAQLYHMGARNAQPGMTVMGDGEGSLTALAASDAVP